MKKEIVFKMPMVLCLIIGLTAFAFSGGANAAIPVGTEKDIFIDSLTDSWTTPQSVAVDEGTWCAAPNENEDAWNAWNGRVTGDPLTEGWLNSYLIVVDGTYIHGGSYPTVKYESEEDAYLALVALGPLYFDVPAGVTEAGFFISDSDDGYLDNVGGISLTLTKVPIPGAVWLLGSGLVCLVGVRRKFKS